jgi:hypothetical protein
MCAEEARQRSVPDDYGVHHVSVQIVKLTHIEKLTCTETILVYKVKVASQL